MSINAIHTESPPLAALDPRLGQEAALAVQLCQDNQQSRSLARDRRRDAQTQRMHRLEQARDKLRQLAGNKLLSGCIGALVAAGSGATGIVGASHASKVTEAAGSAARQLGPSATLYWDLDDAELEQQRAELEARAEVAGQRAQGAGDEASEATRLQASAANLLQRLLEARHQARLSSIRG